MVEVILTQKGTSISFHTSEFEVNNWIQFAQLFKYGIQVSIESEEYQNYLNSFPLNDPRD